MTEPFATILVVDSAAASREALARAFRDRGHRVLEARDAMATFSLLARESVQLVLIDVAVRGGGIDTLRTIRDNRSAEELPIVMLTSDAEGGDAAEAREAGASDCIAKPVDAAALPERVEPLLPVVAPEPAEAAPASPPEPPLSPNRLGPGVVLAGKYAIESKLGTGSFGTVWKARHLDLDTGVAIKVLQRELAATADARSRLQREAISACRIQHPNAVSVTDFGIQGEVVYLVMELLTGRSLEEELALGGRMSVARAIEIVRPVLSVLAAAHATGIIHRDVKPANIFLHRTPRGEVVKVLDFGIAKLVDAPQMTTVGVVLGTPAFMAPERFTGTASDPGGDVYSLATMLFQMITGRLPFMPESRDPMKLAEMKLRQDPPSARAIVPEIPEPVEALLMRALARNPALRPGAAELAEGLSAAAPLAVDALADSDSDTMEMEAEATAVMPAVSVPASPAALAATFASDSEPES